MKTTMDGLYTLQSSHELQCAFSMKYSKSWILWVVTLSTSLYVQPVWLRDEETAWAMAHNPCPVVQKGLISFSPFGWVGWPSLSSHDSVELPNNVALATVFKRCGGTSHDAHGDPHPPGAGGIVWESRWLNRPDNQEIHLISADYVMYMTLNICILYATVSSLA